MTTPALMLESASTTLASLIRDSSSTLKGTLVILMGKNYFHFVREPLRAFACGT